MEKFLRVYRACPVISLALQSLGTNLTPSFDHQALSEIYCGNESSFISCSEGELPMGVNSHNPTTGF